MEFKKVILITLLFFVGCTTNQERRIAERIAPITHSHNIKIIRESLDRPSPIFSFHFIPSGEGSYILKGNHLPTNERFLFASIDGTTGKIHLVHEFEALPDGSMQILDIANPRNEMALTLLAHEGVLVGKQIDYVLVRKKDCTSAMANFLPYPLEAKGRHGERVSLLVTHPMLTRFVLQGQGFLPNEVLQLTHQSENRIEKMELAADEKGDIEADLNPTILGKLGGDARLILLGQSGSIDLHYPWGARLENKTFAHHKTFPILFVANQLPHERDRDPFTNTFFCVN